MKNIRNIISAVLMTASMPLSALTIVNTDIDALVYGLETLSHDDATGVWTLRVTENNGLPNVPTIRLKPTAPKPPAECEAMCFDYISSQPAASIIMRGYKLFMGSATQDFVFNEPLVADTKWRSIRHYVGDMRRATGTKFLNNNKEQYQDLFFDLPVGTEISFRNFRFEDDEAPFVASTVTADAPCIVEAENYNSSASGKTGIISRQHLQEPRARYKNPTGDLFPILAWCSIDYNPEKGYDYLRKQFEELVDCGFNVTLGSGYGEFDYNLLYDDRSYNGVAAAPCKDLPIWIMVKTGLDDWRCEMTTNNCKWSSRLAGFFIKDEPQYHDIPVMRDKVRTIRRVDGDMGHMVYVNNFSSEISYALGFDFEDFLGRFIREAGADYISYDIYPVRQRESTGEIILIPEFLESLEIATRVGKYYNMPVWGFVHSVESNCAVADMRYPTPTEEHMRVQAFGNLAYGCQALQYFTYTCPYDPSYNYTLSPLDADGNKTATWYMVQNINREVQALNWVFLGAELISAGQTNATTPLGCIRLTADMLPQGVSSVASDGQGVCVTQLQNGTNRFLMAVNLDLHNAQTLSVVTTKDTKRVLPDGTVEDLAAGSHEYTLRPGGYFLCLVSENETPLPKRVAPELLRSGYRNDSDHVIVSAADDASNGHYIPLMGDARWDVFVLPRERFDGHIISEEKAIRNWGASFDYDIDIAEDMEVDINFCFSVPEEEYNMMKGVGHAPGYEYIVEGKESLNWPQEYAASMILYIDGQPVQTKLGSEILNFTPQDAFGYNAAADYEKVALKAGSHRLTVTSLCSPWHFDNIRIVNHEIGAVEAVEIATPFKVAAVSGGIEITSGSTFSVCNVAGIVVANGTGSQRVSLPGGVYIVTCEGKSVKLFVK